MLEEISVDDLIEMTLGPHSIWTPEQSHFDDVDNHYYLLAVRPLKAPSRQIQGLVNASAVQEPKFCQRDSEQNSRHLTIL